MLRERICRCTSELCAAFVYIPSIESLLELMLKHAMVLLVEVLGRSIYRRRRTGHLRREDSMSRIVGFGTTTSS
jgi:hypothetical protein